MKKSKKAASQDKLAGMHAKGYRQGGDDARDMIASALKKWGHPELAARVKADEHRRMWYDVPRRRLKPQ